jgi:hypothetical protein
MYANYDKAKKELKALTKHKKGAEKISAALQWFVDATIWEGDTRVIIKKCKAIVSSSGRETIYFKEQDSGINIFTLSENPNMTIKKSL